MEVLNKKIKISKDGINEIIDLAEPTFIPQYDNKNFTVQRIIEVTSEYDRRVDLISLAVYNSDQHSDIIMKCNELSDPLNVRTGDILVIPMLDGAKKFYKNPQKDSVEAKQKQLDSTKKSKVDNKRLQTFAKISASIKNGSTENIKPNELKQGESNIQVNKETNSLSV